MFILAPCIQGYLPSSGLRKQILTRNGQFPSPKNEERACCSMCSPWRWKRIQIKDLRVMLMLMLIIIICKRHTWRMQAMAFTQRTINIRTPWHNDTHFLIDNTHIYKSNVSANTYWSKNTNNVRMNTDLQDTTVIFANPQIGKTRVFFSQSQR